MGFLVNDMLYGLVVDASVSAAELWEAASSAVAKVLEDVRKNERFL